MNISLELYKTFYFVAKNENITRAANEMMISQPAISKSIKTLEDQIGSKLFIRKREGVILTDVGETLYKKIKQAMELVISAEEDLKALTNMEVGTINIGASKTILHEFLMKYIKKFHEEYPKINIRIFTDKTEDLVKKVRIGLIDVIFINMPYNLPSDFETYNVMDLHDCLAANKEFEYLKDKEISTSNLENMPLLVLTKGTLNRSRLDEFCVKNNINIHPKMEFGSNTLIKDFTKAGFGIGMLTYEHIKKEIDNGELFKLNYDFQLKEKFLGMAYILENKNLITKNFIKYIKNDIFNNSNRKA